MNGHVFQTFQESRDRRQFLKTMEALGHYINKNMKFGSDLTVLYKHLRLPTIAKPSADGLDLVNNPADKIEWAETYKIYVSRRRELEDNLRNVYAVAWGQCSEPMKAKLQSFAEFEDKDGVCDCVWLLTSVRAVTYKFDEQRDVCLSLCEARWLLESKRQQPQDTDAAHFEDFKTLVDTYEHFGGSIGADSGLLCELRNEHKNDKDSPGPIPTLDQSDPSGSYVALCDYYQRLDMFEEKLKQIAKARTLATMFLRSLDKHRYGPLLTDLHNQHSRGNYQYPQDLSAAYALILTYESPTRPPPRPSGPDRNSHLTFAQTEDGVPGRDGISHPGITCFNCHRRGHYARQCPIASDSPQHQMFQVTGLDFCFPVNNDACLSDDAAYDHELLFTQHAIGRTIPAHWILLDSQSTVSVFRNRLFLRNIRPSARPLKVHTNGGTQVSHLVGDLTNFGTVWYNPDSLANILSLAQVRQQCRITMDTAVEPALVVHHTDGSCMKFIEYDTGLYYFDASSGLSDPSSLADNPSSLPVTPYSFVHTVADNLRAYSRAQVQGANQARELYIKLGRPGQTHFEQLITNNLITNCPVSIDDARRAIEIYGPDIASLKGKTTKTQSLPNEHTVPSGVPRHIMDKYRDVNISQDIFFVQGIPFFHTISKHLKFRTATILSNRKQPTLLKETERVIKLYNKRGFRVTGIHADQEFSCLEDDIDTLQLVPADEHVNDVERSIRTVKQRT